ncbi:hypothetical protein [Halomicrobium salinisoli]|uniref:hypothetical protein n=1 Tax=Halomicrobium salinisoli TaxID=2878391 RepID=UPI001CF030F3|nr:hypothetical protein [Halomicrobium salinisoli]
MGLLVYGLVTLQIGMALNGTFALLVTFVPGLIRREYGYTMDVGIVLWLTLAVFLHSLGSVALYGWFSWYDSLTHTVSSIVVAGIGYALFRAIERHTDDLDVPSEFRAMFIIVFVLAAGVFWEILEFASELSATVFGIPAPLAVLGIDDIVTDLIFNVVGAVIVAAFGTGYVSGVSGFIRRQFVSDDG